MDALVEEALANNRDLRAAVVHLEQAKALLGRAQATRQPSTVIGAGAGYGSTLEDQIAAASAGGDRIRTGPRYDAAAAVSWEPDLFGQLRAGVRAAQADAAASAALADGVRIAVAADVTGAFLRACGKAHELSIARERLALARQASDLAEALREAGAGVPEDVLRREAEADHLAATILPIEATRRDALAELAVLTGQTPDAVSPAAAACLQVPALQGQPGLGDGYALLRRRPDVRAAERQLAAATARIGVAVADLYPHITLGAQPAVSSPDLDGLGKRANMVWRLGPLLDWSFPNIGVARARVRAARAAEAAALARYDGAVLKALREVNEAARDYGAALERQAAFSRAAQRAIVVKDLMERRRAAGGATALEVLAGQEAASASAARWAEADTDVAAAQVRLFKALGGGWENAPATLLPARSDVRMVPSPSFSAAPFAASAK